MPFITRLATLFPWLLFVAMVVLNIAHQATLSDVQSELDRALAEKATATAGLEVAESFNQSLNHTISELSAAVAEERQAYAVMNDYAAAVDNRMNAAVTELTELLGAEREEESDCIDRLPQPVIDRMWQHYRAESAHGNAG